jgi:serine/threonine-protein kinase
VSPRLSGITLAEHLHCGPDREAPEFARQALSWIDDLLFALCRVHEVGWVHRDVKPQNVFLAPSRDGRAWLIDFGLALPIGAPRHDHDEAFGTPAYVSPEVIAGAQIDERADLYSVGLILFELFAGRRPFTSRDPVELLDAHLSETPPRLRDLCASPSKALDGAIAAALAKHPTDRPPTARAFRELLRQAPEGREEVSPRSPA